MNSIFTNDIEANSFLGLITNAQKKNGRKLFTRKLFVAVEGTEVLRNLALATVVIVMGLTAGSLSQQHMELAQYAVPVTQAAV